MRDVPEIDWKSDTYQLPDSVTTLLTRCELQFLHALARDYYSGAGAVVDAGPFLGGSTVALLDGLAENPQFRSQHDRVHVFDLFEIGEHPTIWGKLGPKIGAGTKYLDQFRRNLGGRESQVVIHDGDILEKTWTGGPIEILFLDIIKTPAILTKIEQMFYPHLIPGRSIIIQQDFQFPFCPWIHLSMHALRDYFSVVEFLPMNSAVYVLDHEIPERLLGSGRYEQLGWEEKLALCRESISLLPDRARLMLGMDEVVMLAERSSEAAEARLLEIEREAHTDPETYQIVVGNAVNLLPGYFAPHVTLNPEQEGFSDLRLQLASQMTAVERLVLYTLVRALLPKRILEVGRARGGSTYVIDQAARHSPGGRCVSMDPNNLPPHRIVPALREHLQAGVHFIDGYCPQELAAAEEAAGGKFDLVFLDGDHSYEAVKRDLLGLLPYVADGGYILMHDAHFHPLKRAIREVVTETGLIDAGNLVAERDEALSHMVADGCPAYYGGMHLLRKPALQPPAPAPPPLPVFPERQLEKLSRQVKRLLKELERERARRFWPKLKRSIAKRLGRHPGHG